MFENTVLQLTKGFSRERIETSVNPIFPYVQTSSPLQIDVTGPSDIDNVSLFYRYSPDNVTWETRFGTLSSIEHNCTKQSNENSSWELLYPNDLILYNNGTADLAVIATFKDNGLSIWNVTGSGNPVFVGAITSSHLVKAHDVKVWNTGTADIAVVLTYNGYITTVDITNPASPKEVGHRYDIAHLYKGFSLVIETEGNFCYAYTAAAGSNSMAIYNVTKTTPEYMGSCLSGKYSLFVEKYDADYVHVSSRDGKKLTVIDVSNKTNPFVFGECLLGAQGWGHCKYENYIYQVTGNDDSLLILNVTSSAIPTYVSKISGTGLPNHLSAPVGVRIYPVGDCLYALVTVAGDDDGLTVINVTNPSNPTYYTGIYGADAPYYMYDPHAIEVLDKNIYLLMYHNSTAPYSFASLWLNLTNPIAIWSSVMNASNPDTSYPWSWDFDFPNGTGYYEFYSIGKKTGSVDEDAPASRDALCRYIRPPNTPQKPSGEIKGNIEVEYTYNTTTTDPDNTSLYYMWSWGDGNMSGWYGPFSSNEVANASHTWMKRGTYEIKVKAKNENGAESDWSEPLSATMPVSYQDIDSHFFERLFERFPHAFPILRRLAEYLKLILFYISVA